MTDKRKAALAVAGAAIAAVAAFFAVQSCLGHPTAPAPSAQSASSATSAARADGVSNPEALKGLNDEESKRFLEAVAAKYPDAGAGSVTVVSEPKRSSGDIVTFYAKGPDGRYWLAKVAGYAAFLDELRERVEGVNDEAYETGSGQSIPAQQDGSAFPAQKTGFDYAGAANLQNMDAAKAAVGEAAVNLYATLGEFMATKGGSVTSPSKVLVPGKATQTASGATAFTALVYSGNDEVLVDVTYDGASGAYTFALSE